jgi:hypothetical protein
MSKRQGKTNQFGRLESSAAYRHRNVLVCLHGALAFYLLHRWDLSNEQFPNLAQPSQWYHTPLLKGTKSQKDSLSTPLAYNTQRHWIEKVFEWANVSSKKKTHVGRSTGAKTAELKEISEVQIQRAGHWTTDQLAGCYLNQLPRKFMRAMAGHPQKAGCFDVRRGNVEVPEELLSMVWPHLEQWKDHRPGYAKSGQLEDLAAGGFIDLLFYLREVVLQDSAILRDIFPENSVWKHPVFQHEMYRPFAESVLKFERDSQPAGQLELIQSALPALNDYLQSNDLRNRQQLEQLEQRLIEKFSQHSSKMVSSVTSCLSGLSFRLDTTSLQPLIAKSLASQSNAQSALAAATATSTSTEASELPISQFNQIAQTTLNVSETAIVPQVEVISSSSGILVNQPLDHPALSGGEEPPKYKMDRQINTVNRLWVDWTRGYAGQPSIVELDRRWGSRWRTGDRAEIQFYSLRLEIIKEIKQRASNQRLSEEMAMWQLHNEQLRMGYSIDKLCKWLRQRRRNQAARV